MRKIWAVLLAAIMLLSLLPVNVFAQSVNVEEVQIVESGSCGDDMIWTLYANGLLEINGTGEMANWDFFNVSAPWIYYSEDIKKVVISEGVTSIGQNAFCSEDSYFDYNDHFYSALTEIVIPNTVTTVQTNGISGLDVLETIKIPASLTTLVGAAFNNNYALKNYVVDDGNPVFKAVDGVLYSKDGKTLVSYPIGSEAESYTIPDGTETIAAYAFSQCSSVLKEVVFNQELTFIDDEAFQNCDGIESIELPDSLKELGGGVFQECSALAEIDLPEGMTRIGGRAFDATAYYNDWSNWEDTVLYIGPYLLETTYITPELDWDEWREKSGTLVVRDGTTLIADESVDSSTVDAVQFNEGLQHIGFAAFCWLDIASISLPDSLVSLGDWAFYNCELLEEIRIGTNLQYIGHDALGNTPYDNDSNYVDGILYYGPYVLGFNEKLPNDVTLREGTTLIAERAFWKEDGRLDSPDYGAGMETISFPETLTTICDGAFYSCNNLKTLTIPSTVTYIGYQAYGWIKGYDYDIDEETFDKMTDVTIKGYSDTAAEIYATENDIPFVSLDAPTPEVDEKYGVLIESGICDDGLTWKFYDSGTLVISGEGEMMAYSDVNDLYPSWRDSNITSVVIENGVTSIGGFAFAYLKNLERFTIPNSVTYIGHWAFHECDSLTNVVIPDSVTDISDNAFEDCSNLTSVVIGNNVTYIGSLAFTDCEKLESVSIPISVKTIDVAAFSQTSLLDVYYSGSEEQKELINIYSSGNSKLLNATWHYNSCIGKAEHVYDDCFDTLCEDCGATREISHNFNIWNFNDDYHWFECECGAAEEPIIYGHGWSRNFDENEHWLECECGHKTDFGAHEFSIPNSDESYHWYECICGMKEESGFAEHNYLMYYDEDTHWLECDCFHKKDTENHTYSNAVDPDCDVCLATREITFSGWFAEGGKWYFYENGNKVIGAWRKDSKGWVYLGSDGAMVTNKWVTDSNGWCYVGADGYCVTNKWVKDSKGWCYLNANGNMVINNWVFDGGKWYFLDANGYMVSNAWRKDSKGWCYLTSSGAMVTNAWVKDSIGWCYVGADGYCVTSQWKADSKGWCYLNANGNMVVNNWVQSSGKWYFMDANGYMISNTSKYWNGKKYYFNASGVCTNP